MYKSLQAGRAVAAMLVVLFHLGGAIAAEKYFGLTEAAVPFSFGGAGVPFFFVLSGFIILTAHRNDVFKPHRLGAYLKKRLIRIYPTYWIIFLSVFFLASLSAALRSTLPQDFAIIVQALLLLPEENSILNSTPPPVLAVAWTLQYEILFYAFFAVVILNRWLSAAIGLGMLYVYFRYTGTPALSFPLVFLAQDYILLFALGMVVSWMCTSDKTRAARPLFYAVTGALLFILIAADTVFATEQVKQWKTLAYGFASCMIIFGVVQAEDRGRTIGGNRWWQLLGDASYALYLLHYPLISILCKLLTLLQFHRYGVPAAITSFIAIFAACLITSVAFHLWVERPVTGYLRARWLAKR